MANTGYRHGDPWVIDDVSGLKVRKSDTVKQWDGNIVDRRRADPRHPQDFVRARKEDIAVPDARPRPPEAFVGPNQSNLSAAASAGATTLPLDSSAGFAIGHRLLIMLADRNSFLTTVASVPDGVSITISPGLAGAAAAGALVRNMSAATEAALP